MADEGGAGGLSGGVGQNDSHATITAANNQDVRKSINIAVLPKRDTESTTELTAKTPKPFSRAQSRFDIGNYVAGPRDISRHSKWPLFMQAHGSILPKLIVPLFFLGSWATFITIISKYTSANLGISNTLLTITGFVVGLSLSFRSSTAYERYSEGRRYWAQLILVSNCLGRVFWLHVKEREESHKRDVLTKLAAMKLLAAFAVALKHKLRFEPYTDYEDLAGLVSHLDTYARAATVHDPGRVTEKRQGLLKTVGESLGLSIAQSNPRKAIKRSQRPLGNLPLEILSHLASLADDFIDGRQLERAHHNLLYNNITALNDVLIGTERVLTTPVPIAYAIAINQITWLYVYLLPFQLLNTLNWVTIPATLAAGYIILGLLFIGREVENPFGNDVNDLPLEDYCAQIAGEIDLLTSKPKPRASDWVESLDNKTLWPLSPGGWDVWESRDEADLRAALRTKYEAGYSTTVDGGGRSESVTIVRQNTGTSVKEPEKAKLPTGDDAV